MTVRDLTVGAVVAAAEFPETAAALAIIMAGQAIRAFGKLRGTTLAAPAVWCVVAALAIALVEIGLMLRGPTANPLWASLWRYAAAVGVLCPVTAVLGAKRPQDHGWQWVVLSLWLILLAPVGQALAASSGDRLELAGVWRLLLVALIAMTLLNYLPTRQCVAGVLFALGQTCLLADYLFDFTAEFTDLRMTGLVLLMAAGAAAEISRPARRRRPEYNKDMLSDLERFSRRWMGFRDAFGAFWGLRVLQRINQTAELSDWPVRLEWRRGFVPADQQLNGNAAAPLGEETAAHMRQTLESLLRRFERVDSRH